MMGYHIGHPIICFVITDQFKFLIKHIIISAINIRLTVGQTLSNRIKLLNP